jgi:hypothetical protein
MVPQPGATGGTGHDNVLYGDTCVSERDCWAVGSYSNKAGAQLNEIFRWDGRKWSQISAPEPGGTKSGDVNQLYDVSCTSPRSCWAVGSYQPIAFARLNEILRWDGKRWRKVPVRNPAGKSSNADQNDLFGSFCSSASGCWAVGQTSTSAGLRFRNQALHLTGRKWSLIATPRQGNQDYLDGFGCSSRRSCWAVGGSFSNGAYLNELLRWNGTKFLRTKAPQPGGTGKKSLNFLYEVSCPSASECFTVGNVSRNQGISYRNEILRWDGRGWNAQHVPNPAGAGSGHESILDWVTCFSRRDCWAVGQTSTDGGTTYADQEIGWDGKRWKVK